MNNPWIVEVSEEDLNDAAKCAAISEKALREACEELVVRQKQAFEEIVIRLARNSD